MTQNVLSIPFQGRVDCNVKSHRLIQKPKPVRQYKSCTFQICDLKFAKFERDSGRILRKITLVILGEGGGFQGRIIRILKSEIKIFELIRKI